MKEIVGVVFKNNKIYYFVPNNYKLKKNTTVIVETDYGLQFGKIELPNFLLEEKKIPKKLNKIIKIANKNDYIQNKKNINDSLIALNKAKELSQKRELDMNIIDAEYSFDRKQLIFNFLADSRIDFRDLVKDLANIYKTRIELRQIGVRDKAKQVGGMGHCGRQLCCSSFLKNLDNVTISMVKNQNLTLNPNKINGACGRLLCCLKYEDESYTKCRRCLPKIGDLIETKEGIGKVISVEILPGKYKLLLKNGDIIEKEVEKSGCC